MTQKELLEEIVRLLKREHPDWQFDEASMIDIGRSIDWQTYVTVPGIPQSKTFPVAVGEEG